MVPDASLVVWPLRVRCDYDLGAGATRSQLIGPSVAETLAWGALVALLAGASLTRRRSAPLRGALVAACFLAPVAAGLLYSEFVFAFWVALYVGVPLAVALDLVLRAPGERQLWRSVVAGCGLSATAFVVCLAGHFAGVGRAGIAAAIVAGALVAALLARASPARAGV